MRRRFGKLTVHHLFDWRNRTADRIEATIDEFLRDGDVGERAATRWIQTQKGVLLLQMIKGDPECGVIFIFDRLREQWYLVDFDTWNYRMTPALFDRIYREYKLFAYVEQPGLLLSLVQPKHA